jgi:hypothetical protein
MTMIQLVLCLLLPCAWSLPGAPSTRPSDLMKKKSEHAQAIFKYLAQGDLERVQSEAESLEKIISDAGFEGKSKQYAEYGRELLRTVKELKNTAAKKNFTGAYFQFSRMSSVCFSCHEHLRETREKEN